MEALGKPEHERHVAVDFAGVVMKLNRTILPKILKFLITGLLSLVLAYLLFAMGFVLWPDIND